VAPKIVSGAELAEKFGRFADSSPDSFYFVPDEHVAAVREEEGKPPRAELISEGDRKSRLPLHIPLERGFVDRVRGLVTPLSGVERDALVALGNGQPLSEGALEPIRERIAPGAVDIDAGTLGDV